MQENKNNQKGDRLLRIMGAYMGVAEERKKARVEEEAKKKQALTSHLTEADGTEIPIAGDIMSHFASDDDILSNSGLTAHFADSDTAPKAQKKPLPKGVRGVLKAGLGAVRASSFLIKLVIYITVVIIISAYCSYYAISIANDVFALVKEEVSYTVTVDENTTVDSLSAELEENGIIRYADVFRLYVFTQQDDVQEGSEGSASLFLPGEHTLKSTMNYSQIYLILSSRSAARQSVKVTIPEGVTTDQLIDILVDAGIGERDKYVEAINNYPYKHEFVKLLDESGWSEYRTYRLDGYLFPDTYEFYTDSEEYLVINKLLNTFNSRFWKDYKKTYKAYLESQTLSLGIDDIVTLASLVQSEGGQPEDYEYIAYVFTNRLAHASKYPKLESDATINYILSLSGEHHEDLTSSDLGLDNRYNTYLYDGLPPGAICNPGLDALIASVYPLKPVTSSGKEIDAYYFVSSKLGNTYFAATYSAHLTNVATVKKENKEYEAGNGSD